MVEVIANYEDYSKQMIGQLQIFRQLLQDSRGFQFSSTELSTLPEPVLAPFAPASPMRRSAFRMKIAQLCHEWDNGNIVPRGLHSVCLLDHLRVKMTSYNNSALVGPYKSWLIAQDKAIEGYEAESKTDFNSIKDRLLNFPHGQEYGNSLPMY